MLARIIAFFRPEPVCEICHMQVAEAARPFCAAHESEYVSRAAW